MKKFKEGDLVKSKAEGIGKVTNVSVFGLYTIEVTFHKYNNRMVFTEAGGYLLSGAHTNHDIKHISKLEKYLYETEA